MSTRRTRAAIGATVTAATLLSGLPGATAHESSPELPDVGAVMTFTGTAVGRIAAPTTEGGVDGLLVVFEGDRLGDPADAVDEAQAAAAPGVDLFVAIAGPVGGPGIAEVQFAALRAEAAAAGFEGTAASIVVASAGPSSALSTMTIGENFDLGGTALLGTNPPDTIVAGIDRPLLRVGAEIDPTARVSRLAVAGAARDADRPVVLIDGADASEGQGGTLGAFVEATVTDDRTDLDTAVEGSPLLAAFDGALHGETGAVCIDAQRITADVAPADTARMSIANRAWTDIMQPEHETIIAENDFGGFLYDKASVAEHDDGTIALVTNSLPLFPPASGTDATPVGAAEIMCKTKSRAVIADALYDDLTAVDDTPPTCADVNAAVIGEALDAISPAAAARFAGLRFQPDDMKRAGPEWVFAPMVLHPDPLDVDGPGGWTIQAPALLTEPTTPGFDPEFAGNHYCKVLSPVRALELVLTDAVNRSDAVAHPG